MLQLPRLVASVSAVAAWILCAGFPAGAAPSMGIDLVRFERTLITPNVAYYKTQLRVGPGEFDVIGLHRVVRERAPHVPTRTSDAVMFAHGDIWDFEALFLANLGTAAVSVEHSLAVFLAQNNVDVWGISHRWTRVPADADDLSFMASWDISTDAGDLRSALALARFVRATQGNGMPKMSLLAMSSGGHVGYAYLVNEAGMPPGLRHVKGYIPVDIYVKTDDPGLRAAACERLADLQLLLALGETASDVGQLMAWIGALALDLPGDPSPLIPGMTNREVALLTGAATFVFFPPGLEPAPFYHFTAGFFDKFDVPTGLRYSQEELLFTLLASASPWQPLRHTAELEAATCGGPGAPPWSNRLNQIRVPVLYVGAGGGFGDLGLYTTSLLGTTDVTTLIVEIEPPEDRQIDFGHVDTLLADNAPLLIWHGILDWLRR